MSMAVFNRPSAGECPLCGAKMYYKQTPIMLEYFYEKYDVWASVKYCDECGIQVMVPGEAKIAKHDSRHAVEEQIRKAEQTAKAKAEMQKPKVHAFAPKNEEKKEPEPSKDKKILPSFKRDKDNRSGENRSNAVSVPGTKQPIVNNGTVKTKPQHQEKQPGQQAPAERMQSNDSQKTAPAKSQQQTKPTQSGQPAQMRPQQKPRENLKTSQGNKPDTRNNMQPHRGIPEAIRNRLPIGQTKPGELPGTMGRYGLSDFQLTASAAQNISNLLDLTEDRDRKKAEKAGDQKVLSAKNVDEVIFAEEMETAPQLNRKNKKERDQIERPAKQQPAASTNAQRNVEKQQPANKTQNAVKQPDAGTKIENSAGVNQQQRAMQKQPSAEQRPQSQKQGATKQPQAVEQQKSAKQQVMPAQPQKQAAETVKVKTAEKSEQKSSATPAASQEKSTGKGNGQTAITTDKPAEDNKPQQKVDSVPSANPGQEKTCGDGTTEQPSKEKTIQQAAQSKTEKADERHKPEVPESAEATNSAASVQKSEPVTGQMNGEKTEEKPITQEPPQPAKEQQPQPTETKAQADKKEAERNTDEPVHENEQPESAASATQKTEKKDAEQQTADSHKENKNHDFLNLRKSVAKHLPKWVVSRIPFLAEITDNHIDVPIAVEKDFVKKCEPPHRREIIDNLLYDTDTSEMFLKKSGSYGFDRPCVHYNYCSPNGHFFRCSVRYDSKNKGGHVELRPMDAEMEVKPMLRNYPELYKKFFEDDLRDA